MVPVIIGPTAAGKSALAMALARRLPRLEIVSADSRQIYIGLDIGTAKPTLDERRVIPHHMIDIVTPDIRYAAGQFAARAREVIGTIIARGSTPIVVGGSGFYVRALFEGLSAPEVDPVVLAELTRRMEQVGADEMHAELARIDPAAAAANSPNNRVRTLRALACYYATGRRYSEFEGSVETRWSLRPLYVGVAPPRPGLYERINARVIEMVEGGLIEETARVLESGIAPDAPGLRTVGYAEATQHLRGEIGREQMIASIQQSTRRYAKRQMTWFRAVAGINWLEFPDVEAGIALLGDTLGSEGREG